MTRPKRLRGTGSLYQLPNGYWRGLYRVTNESGKRVPQYVGDWDYDAAEAKLDALVAGVKLPANLGELRARDAVKWAEGAVWAAVELGAIDRADIPWLSPGDNPYE